MSGWSSRADVDTTIKATLRGAGKDPRDYNISGIRREAFHHSGHRLGWGTANAALSEEGWNEIVNRNRRTRKPAAETTVIRNGTETPVLGTPSDSKRCANTGTPDELTCAAQRLARATSQLRARADDESQMRLAEAIRDVVEYNWPHELADYREQDDEGRQRHVFRSLVVLASWLDEVCDDTTANGAETERNLTLWVHTEELWRDLEATAGLALGRFKEWNSLGPAHFSADRFDLDLMIAWARAHGVPHTEERAVHYNGTTGVVDLASEQLHRKTSADRALDDVR